MSRQHIGSRFPDLPITLRIRNRTVNLDALIDTGFDGHVMVPNDTMRGEEPDAYLPYRLADGSSFVCDPYSGVVELAELGRFPTVVLALGNECLIGPEITDQLRLILDHGQQVVAER